MTAPRGMLGLVDVYRSYRLGSVTTQVLHGVDLEVGAGDVVSIMGPSGSGKTTLMNIVGLLDRPTSGNCVLDGRDVSGLGDDALSALRNRRIGFVFQSFHLLPRLTALENVCLPLVYRGAGRAETMDRARAVLERVGMDDRLHHRPDQLSGGQKQRVAIARALVGEPALLLADEPTGALDADTAREAMDLLLELNAERGVTILIITHDPAIANQCARRLRIRDGRLVEALAHDPGAADAVVPRHPSPPGDIHKGAAARPRGPTPGAGTLSRALAVLGANAREATDSLRKARLRTVLGLVGIMIGISSVIAMVSLGEIAKAQARKQFEALGTDILLVRRSFDAEPPGQRPATIALSDAIHLAPAVASIVEAAPRISGHGRFRYAGRNVGSGSIQGVTASFADVNRLSVQAGRFISDLDVDRYWCVVGADVADAMRRAGADRFVGEIVEIDEVLCTIVGVLNDRTESYALPVQVDANESVFVPITTSGRVVPDPEIDVIVARSRPGVHYETAVADVRSFFRDRAPALKLEIVAAKDLIARLEAQMRNYTLLLGAVGSIALMVGGIGIMNIMLVSVAERRREIAIRRALGARRRDIQSQFLIESVILTTAGGVLGVVLGLAATWAICRFTGWEYFVSGVSVASGLGTATAVGLFFGYQPARQASRLDPIAGLQGE